MSINEEYFVMIYNFSHKERLDYVMGAYASAYSHKFQYDGINQPVRYDIDDEFWKKGRIPADIILDSDGLIIKDKLKTEFFEPFDHDNIMTHLTYFVSPDGDYFEGYWLLSTPDKPKEWLDIEKCTFEYEDDDPKKEIYGIEKYFLNTELISKIPLEQRQLFTWNAKDFGDTHQIIHKSWVNYLKKFDNRNVKFIPLLKFEDTMAMEGPLPSFAI